MNAQLTFQFRINPLSPNLSISVVGNISELGHWSDPNIHPLYLIPSTENLYISANPLSLPIGASFQYKIVIAEIENSKSKIKYWETLPYNTNRHYQVHRVAITLSGIVGEIKIDEISYKNYPNLKKNDSNDFHEFQQNKIDSLEEFNLKKTTKKICHSDHRHRKNSNVSDEQEHKRINSMERISSPKQLFKKRKEMKKKEGGYSGVDSRSISDASLSSLMEYGIGKQESLPNIAGSRVFNEEVKEVNIKLLFEELMERNTNRLMLEGIKSDNDIVYQISEDYEKSSNFDRNYVMAMLYLPFTLNLTLIDGKLKKIEVTINQTIDLHPFNLHLFTQSKTSFKKVIWVGMLYQELPEIYRPQIKAILYERYKCIPIFPDHNVHSHFIYYCKEILDPLLSNSNLSDVTSKINCIFSYWNAFKTMNEIFSDAIIQNISREELISKPESSKGWQNFLLQNTKDDNLGNTFIFICDHRLLLASLYLSKKANKNNIAFYFSSSFPFYENLIVLPHYDEIMEAVLLNNIICFFDYLHAKRFFHAINNIFGLKKKSNRGLLTVNYMGRQIIINIMSMGLDLANCDLNKKKEEFKIKQNFMIEKYSKQKLILSIDNIEKLPALIQQLKFLRDFMNDISGSDTVKEASKFIQIINFDFWEIFLFINNKKWKRKCEIGLKQMSNLMNEIKKMGIWDISIIINTEIWDYISSELKEDNCIFQLFEVQKFNRIDLSALQSISKIYLKTSFKELSGFEAYEYLDLTYGNGFALFSIFFQTNPLISKIFKFNPHNYADFKDHLLLCLQNKIQTILTQEIHKSFAMSNWFDQITMNLKKSAFFSLNAKFMKEEVMNSHQSVGLKKVANKEFFKYLNNKEFFKKFKNSYNRIIILDYEGTIVQSDDFEECSIRNDVEDSEDYGKMVQKLCLKPNSTALNALKTISNDPRNNVFLLTSKSKEMLGPWITDIKNLNIFSEYGYLFKLKKSTKWIPIFDSTDWSWKNLALKIMELYVINTEGSEILMKRCSVVWNFKDVHEDFGTKQADLLEAQLKSSIGFMKEIRIVRGKYFIEVLPYGINKGNSAEIIIEKVFQERGEIDLILAIGQELSDEEVFTTIKNNYDKNKKFFDLEKFSSYSCCVGKKPSNAEYYLKNVEDVEEFLDKLVSRHKTQKQN